MAIKIPRDTSAAKEAILAAFKKKTAVPTVIVKDPAAKARAEKEAAARVRAKELKAELDTTKATAEEKDAAIAELKEQLRATIEERDKFKPLAEQMKSFDHVERTKLVEQLPAEERKAAKDLPLLQLRTFVRAFTSTTPGAIAANGAPKTEEELLKLADTNPTAFLAELEKKETAGKKPTV
jgi:hypothetical protein